MSPSAMTIAQRLWLGGGSLAAVFVLVGVALLTLGHESAPAPGNMVAFALPLLLAGAVVAVATGWAVGRAVVGTERVAAEQAERLRTTLASIGDAVIATDTAGRVSTLNAVAVTLTGWPAADAVGEPLDTVFRIVNEASRQPVESPATRALREGVVVGLANHTILIARDGTERPIDDSAAPIRCKAGEVVGCVLVFRDITERRAAERAADERNRLVALRGDVSAALATTFPMRAGLQGCCEALVRHLGAAFARVWTLDEAADVLALQASAGLYTHLDGPHGRVNVGAFKIGRIAASRQPHLTNDVPHDPNVSDQAWAVREGMVAFAGYPLLVDGRVVGVVALFARQPLGDATLTDLAPLADQLALYVHRTRAEEQLRRSHDTFYHLVANDPLGVYVVDAGFRLVQVSRGCQKVFAGIEPLLGRDFAEVLHVLWPEPFANEAEARFRHTLATGDPFHAPDTTEARGNVSAVESYDWRLERLTLPDGQFGVACYFYETTPLRRVEWQLRESEARQSYLVRLADTLRPLTDPVELQATANRVLGEHVRANRVLYFEIHGPDYVIERDYTAGVGSLAGRYPVASFGEALLAELLAGRTVVESDATAVPTRPPSERAAFAAIDCRGHVDVSLVKGGAFVAGMTVHCRDPRDWTPAEVELVEQTAERTWAAVERARAEAAMRRSEARYRTLFESMDEGYCVLELLYDPAGRPCDYRYLEVNPAFEAQSGLHDATGRRILEFVPSIEDHWLAAYDHVIRTGEPTRFANEAKGLGRWFEVYAFRLGDPGSLRLAILFTDITARRQAEEELRRLAAELSAADRRKDEFLATLAHELRNPLAPLRTGLQVVKAADEREVREQARAMMERQLEQMVRLVDDLMDVSRISRDKLELRRERLPLATVLASAIETSRPLIEQMGHALTVALPAEPVAVDADRTRLAQVFLNLLNNSAKYMDRGGHVWLTVTRDGDSAVVAVRDAGIGIAADQLPHVFDLFSQVDRSLEKAQGGLGIGLTLVKRLVEMHGGTIEAFSDGPGRGAEFVVRLPVAAAAATPAEPRPVDHTDPAVGLRVLVVDDNRDGADALATMLRVTGHTPQVVYDGEAAVVAAAAFRPDVILLDLGLPKLNGYDVCRRIREQQADPPPVVIAQTGWGADEDRQRTRAAGFDHHLVKPIDPLALMRLLAGLPQPAV